MPFHESVIRVFSVSFSKKWVGQAMEMKRFNSLTCSNKSSNLTICVRFCKPFSISQCSSSLILGCQLLSDYQSYQNFKLPECINPLSCLVHVVD